MKTISYQEKIANLEASARKGWVSRESARKTIAFLNKKQKEKPQGKIEKEEFAEPIQEQFSL